MATNAKISLRRASVIIIVLMRLTSFLYRSASLNARKDEDALEGSRIGMQADGQDAGVRCVRVRACASGACVHRHSSQPCSEAGHQHLTIKQAVPCFTSPSELETYNVFLKTAVFCLIITVWHSFYKQNLNLCITNREISFEVIRLNGFSV